MKIIVLCGGLSPERDVSLSSGALISNALIENGHDVMLLDLFLGKDNNEIEPIYRNSKSDYRFAYSVPEIEPDLQALKADSDNAFIGNGVIELCKEADAVFMGLHGSAGENGQLQAAFDLHGIRYTGTGYTGSLLAMDKDISKRLMRESNILTADWRYINLSDGIDFDRIKFPCVVKPCNCGSSVGITIVENTDQLKCALDYAGQYEEFAIIEEKITGREFSVGILNGEALPVIEIKPLCGFYDYKNKYQKGLTEEICPAAISKGLETLLQNNALTVHHILRLGFYSRIDFIADDNGRVFCLEANTLPGMTPTSLLPQEALAAGISYNELCNKIVNG